MLTSKSLIDSVIDWIWSFNRNQTNTTTRPEIYNAAQEDEQHNTPLRRRNHELSQKKKLDKCENHLFKLKEMRKKYMQMGDSISKMI